MLFGQVIYRIVNRFFFFFLLKNFNLINLDRKEIAEMLVKNGADVNYVNSYNDGITPLLYAVMQGNI